MRIISGRARGLHLAPVGEGDTKAHLRPTSDRVREAIFNLLVNGGYGDPITNCHVLDLFAGTGALGLEALSRGASQVTCVDDGKVALGLLQRNIALMKAAAEVTVIRRNATQLGAGPPHGLVFMDPPYGKGLGELALASATAGGWIGPEALVVWEESTAPAVPTGFRQLDQRRYGDTLVTILMRDD
jgi:16S rRNA (guanine966-N2)-methyltransferase